MIKRRSNTSPSRMLVHPSSGDGLRRCYRFIASMLLTAILSIGCSSNDSPASDIVDIPLWQKEIPPLTRLQLAEISRTDNVQVTLLHSYTYQNQQLIKVESTQRYDEMDYALTTTTKLNYVLKEDTDSREVVITSDAGSKALYLLNNQGLATTCTYQSAGQTRRYKFAYTDNQLTDIEESIDGMEQEAVTLRFTYNANGDLTSIITPEETYEVQCTDTPANDYRLPPCLFILDLHPLSLHGPALYARLLGKQSNHWVSHLKPSHREHNENTAYSYDLSDNKLTGITEKTTSTGNVIDVNGQVSSATKTYTRSVKTKFD